MNRRHLNVKPKLTYDLPPNGDHSEHVKNVCSGSEAEVQQARPGCLLLAISGHTAARRQPTSRFQGMRAFASDNRN